MFYIFRLALCFDAQDNTWTINLTVFIDTVAQLFGITINEIYAPKTYVSHCINTL